MFNYNMDNIRVISLKKKTNKRQLYKDILSSSSKVRDIISKRKTRNKKFDYLDRVPKGNVLINLTEPTQPISNIPLNETITKKPLTIEKSSVCPKKHISPKKSKILNTRCTSPKKVQFTSQRHINTPLPSEGETPKSFDTLIPKGKTHKVTQSSQKKIDDFFKNKSNHSITGKLNRIFTKKELIQICSIIKKFSHDNNYSKIHYIIRKINRNQTIQLLKVYNISKNRSKAPIALLKNILFNYLTSNIILIY